MKLTPRDEQMLAGHHGEPLRKAMEALVTLGRAYGAEDMVDIGYAHIHAGMAMYKDDVQLMEALADAGARVAVPSSANIANADLVNWRQTGAPEPLARLQQRAAHAHNAMGSACAFTCTPYWAGHWPTWNMHMVSIESTVTIFCNSVLGARSNRDGFFAVYAAMTGRYPRFGYHLDASRRGSHLVRVECVPESVSDYSALGFHVGRSLGGGVAVFDGFARRPTLDELDALGAALGTSGGISMFIVPGVTPPYATVEDAFPRGRPTGAIVADEAGIRATYDHFSVGDGTFDLVHIGCPHASFEEMKDYARMLDGRRIRDGLELWVTTSRSVRNMAAEAGYVAVIERAGARVISDTCPMSCHFARTASPDPALGVKPPTLRGIVVDSAKQAKYVRDMVRCPVLLTSTEKAIESALSGRFAPRFAA
jgi:cis-L-3-hydroxyproline dehydratase